MTPEMLAPEIKQQIDEIEESGVTVLRISCFTDIGIMEARNVACDALLAMRVENKMSTGRVTNDVFTYFSLTYSSSISHTLVIYLSSTSHLLLIHISSTSHS